VQAVDALWHVAIYAISSLVLFAEADWRLMIPLLPGSSPTSARCLLRATGEGTLGGASDARSKLMGRIVDGYTNITTLKLFAHTTRSNTPARRSPNRPKGPAGRPRGDQHGRGITSMNGLLIVGTTGLALWLWSQSLITVGAIALATGLVIRIVNMSGWIMWVVNGIFENIGMVQDGLQTIASPRQVTDRPLPRPAVARGACASRMWISLRQRRGRDPGLQLDIARRRSA
jgi:ATP-binding cassette subfamily B multidrug efflux pump